MEVRYERICKTFGLMDAVTDLDLHVPDGAFLALLGPSGCGKTTALRILAGLEQPTSGRVLIGDRDVTDLQPKDRDVAMVFQSYALYPHKNVADNIAYPLRVRKVPREKRQERAAEVARMLDIDGLLDRMPKQLSGGQRQRVALARAIIREPHAFLMDEPLSNLDAQLRLQMRAEIKRLQRDLRHDHRLCDPRPGRGDDDGRPGCGHAARAAPAARAAGRGLRPSGQPVRRPVLRLAADERARRDGRGRPLPPPLRRGAAPGRRHAGPVKLGFRPENAQMTAPGEAGSLAGEVYVVEPLGNETLIAVTVGGEQVNLRAPAGFEPAVGEPCGVRPDPGRLHLFDPDTEAAIETAAGTLPAAEHPTRTEEPDDGTR